MTYLGSVTFQTRQTPKAKFLTGLKAAAEWLLFQMGNVDIMAPL